MAGRAGGQTNREQEQEAERAPKLASQPAATAVPPRMNPAVSDLRQEGRQAASPPQYPLLKLPRPSLPLLLPLVSSKNSMNTKINGCGQTRIDGGGGRRTWSHIHFGARELELGGRGSGQQADEDETENGRAGGVCT